MPIYRIPIYIVPQISDDEWNIIASLSEQEQLQLLSNNLAMEDQDGHQISMDELIALIKEVATDDN